jgi:uncharacterized protein YoxC
MLGQTANARLAYTTILPRERRLLCFATIPGNAGRNDRYPDGMPQPENRDHIPPTPDVAPLRQDIRNQMQNTLYQPAEPAVQRTPAPRTPDLYRPASDTGSEPQARVAADISRIAEGTRTRLSRALGNIQVLNIEGTNVLNHGIAENPLFSLSGYLEQTRNRIESSLRYAETGQSNLSQAERDIRGLNADVARLEKFDQQLRKVQVVREGGITRVESPLIRENGTRAVAPDSQTRGYFDRGANAIWINSLLAAGEQEAVKQHETGHAILFAIERNLQPDLFGGIRRQQEKAADDDKAFKRLLRETWDSPDSIGSTDAARVETLAKRYAEARYPGADSFTDFRSKTGPNEARLFQMLEAASPALRGGGAYDLLTRALQEEFAHPTGLVPDPAAFAGTLEGLSGSRSLQKVYGQTRGNRREQVNVLMARYRRWREGKAGTTVEDDDGVTQETFRNTDELALFAELDSALQTQIRQEVTKTADGIAEKARRSALFDTLLFKLSIGGDALTPYIPYGNDKAAVMEELVNRFNDFRSGRERESFTDKNELALFHLLDPDLDLEPNLSAAQAGEVLAGAQDETEANARADSPEERGKRFSVADAVPSGADPDLDSAENKEEPVDPVDMQHKLKWLSNDIRDLSGVSQKTADTLMNHGAKPDVVEGWLGSSEILGSALHSVNAWSRAATLVAKWQNPNRIDPGAFISLLPMAIDRKENVKGYEQFLQLIAEAAPGGHWLPSDDPKMLAIGDMLNAILLDIQEQMKSWQTKLDKVREDAQNIERTAKLKPKQGFQIKFYSLKHVIQAVKDVAASYKKAWEQWSTLRSSEVANAIGNKLKGIPWMGDQAKVTLEIDLDHKNDEIKDEFKKHLEHDLADFDHCSQFAHGHPSLLDQHERDPNKFRAVLEYMASKGWLYDIDIVSGSAFGKTLNDKLPHTWAPERKGQYLRDLQQQNSKGQEEAINAGKSRVNNYPDIPPMIEVLKDELRRKNYWATFGILERIVEKGKLAYSPIWASTIIMDAIRHDPLATKFFPKDLLDKFGNDGLPNAMIHKYFKLDRNAIERFQKNPKNKPFESAGVMAGIMVAVEKEVMERNTRAGGRPLVEYKMDDHGHPVADRTELLQIVSQVLAGQYVTGADGKWSLHLYEDIPAFNRYRDTLEKQNNSVEPSKIDDDYYNHENNGSELVLASENIYQQILDVTSQGTFTHKEKARMFLEQLLAHYDTLKKAVEAGKVKPKVLENFLSATRKKMNAVVTSWKAGASSKIVTIRGGKERKSIVIQMIQAHLIDVKPVVQNALIAEMFMQQMNAEGQLVPGIKTTKETLGANIANVDRIIKPNFYDPLPRTVPLNELPIPH